jgi:hypothetical protein
MECEDVRAHLVDFLAGTSTLHPDVEAHLRQCRACARELDELRDTWHLLGRVPGDRPDSAVMQARFEAVLAEYQHASGAHQLRPARPRVSVVSRWLRRPVAQFGLAAAVLLLGVILGRQTLSPPQTDRQIDALRQEVRDIRQMLTLSLMQQQSASDRLKGVTSTGQIDQPGTEVATALLDTLMHDPNVNVRLASIDALRRFAGREAVRHGAVDALPRQTSPLVQIALIDFLGEVAARESTPALRRLSQDPMLDRIVRERAAWVLQQVS